jgi:hypothetical protein
MADLHQAQQYSVREIARQVVANLGLDAGYELAAQWVGQRYAELVARGKFRHLRQYGQIYLPAPIQTGLSTITLDSNVVTLDATGIEACATSPFYKDRWPDRFGGLFYRPQIADTWYRIQNATADGTLYLETAFAQDNGYLFPMPGPGIAQQNIPFFIVPRYVELAPDARQLGIFVCDFMFRPLDLISEDELNIRAPNRFLVWAYPQWVAELNSNVYTTGYPKVVEIYPWPSESITMHYTYWQTPRILGMTDFLPPTIDPDIVRTGAMIDACMNRAGRAIRAGNAEEAAFWTNRGNQYETRFEMKVNRAIRNDRGADDLALILKRGGWKPPVDWDPVKDAYQNFLARGI